MGYSFRKRDATDYYVRLDDASVLRAVASSAGLGARMPHPEAPGGAISEAECELLSAAFREGAVLLEELAEYFDGAEALGWEH